VIDAERKLNIEKKGRTI